MNVYGFFTKLTLQKAAREDMEQVWRMQTEAFAGLLEKFTRRIDETTGCSYCFKTENNVHYCFV